MSSRRDNTLLVGLDLETGGLNPGRNPILSIGLYCASRGAAYEMRLLVEREPGSVVVPEAARLVGWEGDGQWIEQGALQLGDAVDAMADWLTGLRRKLGASALEMVAHNAEFDRSFLDRWVSKAGKKDVLYHPEGDVRLSRRWHCSMLTLRAMLWAGFFPGCRSAALNELRRLRGGVGQEGRHDALVDARDCYEGYLWLQEVMAVGIPWPSLRGEMPEGERRVA